MRSGLISNYSYTVTYKYLLLTFTFKLRLQCHGFGILSSTSMCLLEDDKVELCRLYPGIRPFSFWLSDKTSIKWILIQTIVFKDPQNWILAFHTFILPFTSSNLTVHGSPWYFRGIVGSVGILNRTVIFMLGTSFSEVVVGIRTKITWTNKRFCAE